MQANYDGAIVGARVCAITGAVLKALDRLRGVRGSSTLRA